jgi:hypothetical protein
MNLALVEGLLEGTGDGEWRARLDPSPSHCCVVLSKTNSSDL